MLRTQIQLTDDQMRRLKTQARREGVSVAALIRRGIDQVLEPDGRDRKIQRALRAVGRYRHDPATDVSARHDDYLVGAFEA
jgi:hypothetical protein